MKNGRQIAAAKRKSRGVSLIETVIAITLVTIFSLAAISVSTMASSQTAKSMHSFAAASLCNDVRQCFTVTNTPNELLAALNACGDQYNAEIIVESANAVTFKIDRGVFFVTVKASYGVEGNNTMEAYAEREGKSGRLYEMSYTVPAESTEALVEGSEVTS